MEPVGVASLFSNTTSLIYTHKHSSAVSCLTSDERDKESHIISGLKITTPQPIKEYIQGILNMWDRMEVPAGCGGET